MNSKCLAVKTADNQLSPIGNGCSNLLASRMDTLTEDLAAHKVDRLAHQNMNVPSINIASIWRGDNAIFIGKDYWTADRQREWWAMQIGHSEIPSYALTAVVDSGFDAQVLSYNYHIKNPGAASYYVVGPDGAHFNHYLLRDVPYLNIFGYDYTPTPGADYFGTAPIYGADGYNIFNIFYGMLSVAGVKFVDPLYISRNVSINAYYSTLQSQTDSDCLNSHVGGVGYFHHCLFDCVFPAPHLMNVYDGAHVLIDTASKVKNIQNIVHNLFYIGAQSCVSLGTDTTFEGTPGEQVRPWFIVDNSCLVKRGLSIPGPVAGYLDASSSVMG